MMRLEPRVRVEVKVEEVSVSVLHSDDAFRYRIAYAKIA